MPDPEFKDVKDVIVPDLSAALLAALDVIFPEKSPILEESETQAKWRGGQRSVVTWLHEQLKRQNEG